MTKPLKETSAFRRLANDYLRKEREVHKRLEEWRNADERGEWIPREYYDAASRERDAACEKLRAYMYKTTGVYTYTAIDWALERAKYFTLKQARAIMVQIWNQAVAENVYSTFVGGKRGHEVCTTIDGTPANGQKFDIYAIEKEVTNG